MKCPCYCVKADNTTGYGTKIWQDAVASRMRCKVISYQDREEGMEILHVEEQSRNSKTIRFDAVCMSSMYSIVCLKPTHACQTRLSVETHMPPKRLHYNNFF